MPSFRIALIPDAWSGAARLVEAKLYHKPSESRTFSPHFDGHNNTCGVHHTSLPLVQYAVTETDGM
jgi:hypothetical protein